MAVGRRLHRRSGATRRALLRQTRRPRWRARGAPAGILARASLNTSSWGHANASFAGRRAPAPCGSRRSRRPAGRAARDARPRLARIRRDEIQALAAAGERDAGLVAVFGRQLAHRRRAHVRRIADDQVVARPSVPRTDRSASGGRACRACAGARSVRPPRARRAEMSAASTRACGKARAARIARQPEPVHRSRMRFGATRRPFSRKAMCERGTITRRST